MDHLIPFLLSQIYGQFKPVVTKGVSRDQPLHQPEHQLLISKPSCSKSPDHRLKLVVYQEGHSPRCWSQTPRRSIDNCQSPYFIFALFALLTSLLVKYLHSHPLYYLCYLCYFAIFIRLAQRHQAHPLLTFCFPFMNSRIPSRTRSE